jgi:Glycosyltransferases involved in cell wall biogenesis
MPTEKYIKNRVTAVIPVYNEERFLRQCLESVVDQVDCVILGDNASTDGTEAICREFAEKYPHINYFRNEQNLGSAKNFALCYEKVQTEFMFHTGGHDLILPGYIGKLKKCLENNPDAVVAFSDVDWVDKDGNVILTEQYNNPDSRKRHQGYMMAPYLADPDPHIRATYFILCGKPCKLLYGLFRTESTLDQCLVVREYAGPDLVILFKLLLRGKMLHCPGSGFQFRLAHENDTKQDYMKRINGKSYGTKSSKNAWRHQEAYDLMTKAFLETQSEPSLEKRNRVLYDRMRKFLVKKYGCHANSFWIDTGNLLRNTRRLLITKPWKVFSNMIRSLVTSPNGTK